MCLDLTKGTMPSFCLIWEFKPENTKQRLQMQRVSSIRQPQCSSFVLEHWQDLTYQYQKVRCSWIFVKLKFGHEFRLLQFYCRFILFPFSKSFFCLPKLPFAFFLNWKWSQKRMIWRRALLLDVALLEQRFPVQFTPSKGGVQTQPEEPSLAF